MTGIIPNCPRCAHDSAHDLRGYNYLFYNLFLSSAQDAQDKCEIGLTRLKTPLNQKCELE